MTWKPRCVLAALALGCGTPLSDGSTAPTEPVVTDTETSPVTDTSTDPTVPAPDVALTLALHDSIRSVVVASWDQPVAAEAHVEYSFDDGVWLSAPVRALPVGPASELLFGIPYDTPVEVRIVWDGAASAPVEITTDPLPAAFPQPTLLSSDPSGYWVDGQWLLGSINADDGGWNEGRYWMWIVDRQGRVVWVKRAIDQDFTIYLRISNDGYIWWDQSTFWSKFDGGATSKIRRMGLDGVVIEEVDAPGMHHCFIEMPDGSLVWGSANGFSSEQLRRRWPDGTVTTVWDCEPFYDSLGLTDWCHTNSIFYQAATDRLLLSFPTDDTFVLEVDATTGEEIRWFGHIPQSWAFDQPTSAFQYQHGVTWTDEGTLLMSSQLSPTNVEGLVREYTLDEGTETLTQIWSFGAGDGIDAVNAGEAHRLVNGNTLHNTGTTPRVREITPDDEVVWDLAWQDDRLIGRTIWLQDLYDLRE